MMLMGCWLGWVVSGVHEGDRMEICLSKVFECVDKFLICSTLNCHFGEQGVWLARVHVCGMLSHCQEGENSFIIELLANDAQVSDSVD